MEPALAESLSGATHCMPRASAWALSFAFSLFLESHQYSSRKSPPSGGATSQGLYF